MQSQPYTLPLFPAGSSPLISQLYSEHKLNKDVVDALQAKLSLILPQKTQNSVLIIGGKCGLTAELLIPFCSRIDIVQEEPFLELLTERFVKQRDVKYVFTREGFLGEEHVRPKPDLMKCKIKVYEMAEFYKSHQGEHCYNVILLQNVLVNEKMNILEELLRIEHEVLITMLNPGKIVHQNLYELLAGIEKNILTIFYEHILHERLQNAKYITGRKQQLLFWEIFIWRKKPAGEQGSLHIIHQIKDILKKELQQNIIKQKKIEKGLSTYETSELVEIYKKFHYSDEEFFTVKNFPKTCADKAIKIATENKLGGKALDVGCALGRTTIELASHFEEVIGIDISHAFIEAANQVLASKQSAQLKQKVKFLQADACKLDKSFGKFSFIFGGNLIDRLQDPEQFLVHISEFLEPNGILMLTSPYTWLQEFTPKQKWLGGYMKDGKPVTSVQGLCNILTKQGLKQVHQPEDIRLVMQINPWVFQYTLCNFTYWQKSAQ